MADRIVNQYRKVTGWLARVFPTSYLEVMTEARITQQRTGVYHERQRRPHDGCLTHALNNLLQGERAFTRRELEQIASALRFADLTAWWMSWGWWFYIISNVIQSRHRIFARNCGTYLLQEALLTRNKTADCYELDDLRRLPYVPSHGNRLVGILLNSQRPASKYRHWVAMRKVGTSWYNLDSLLDGPCILPRVMDLNREMVSALCNSGRVLIVLVASQDIPSFRAHSKLPFGLK